MYHKYYCAYCDYSSSTNAVVNHILDHHTDKINRITLLNGIKGNLISILIRSQCNADPTNIFCCFGCKKFWARKSMADTHKKQCTHSIDHINKCKSIHELRTTAEPVQQPSENTNSVLIQELETKIKKLEATIKQLKYDIKDNEEGKIKYDLLSMTIIEYIDRYTREKIADILSSNENSNIENENEIDWYSELITYRECTKFA
jgi:hypothetical protein